MKLLLSAIFGMTLVLGVLWLRTPDDPKTDIISHLGFEECKFDLEYGVDSTFSDQDYSLIMAAAANWILASDKQLCFTLYTVDVNWYDHFVFLSDDSSIIYNTHGGVWQQVGLWLNPHCQRTGCVGLAFRTGDVFLTDYNLYLIAIHEIGHTLGLSHSPNRKDIMYHSVGVMKVSAEDKRVLKCLIEHKQPLWWGNPNCPYEKRGSK